MYVHIGRHGGLPVADVRALALGWSRPHEAAPPLRQPHRGGEHEPPGEVDKRKKKLLATVEFDMPKKAPKAAKKTGGARPRRKATKKTAAR